MRILIISSLIASGVVLTIIADVVLKKSNGNNWKYIAVGFLLYGLIALPVAIAFHYTQFGTLFLVWEAVAVILGVVTASIYFGEVFTIYRLIALLFACAALAFSYK